MFLSYKPQEKENPDHYILTLDKIELKISKCCLEINFIFKSGFHNEHIRTLGFI